MSDSSKFSKIAWLGAVRRCTDISEAQRLVIQEIGDRGDQNGIKAWMSTSKVMAELGVSRDTVKRARKAAEVHGLWIVTRQPPRHRPPDNEPLSAWTTEYRLTMPVERSGAAEPHLTGSGAAEPRKWCTAASEVVQPSPGSGAAEHPQSVISSGNSSGMSGAAHAPDLLDQENYIDVEVVHEPAPADQLPALIDGIEEIGGELVDADPDPEPDEFCQAHMPYGTDQDCRKCMRARFRHDDWKKRNPNHIFDKLRKELRANEPPPAPPCDLCDKDGWRLDHGGRDGDTPKKCDHKPPRPKCDTCKDTGEVLTGTGGGMGLICLHNGGGRRQPEPGELEALRGRVAS